MRFELECFYCGHKWEDTFWNGATVSSKSIRCIICKDRNIKAKKVEERNADVFGYRYSPKFEPKPITLDDYDT